jgi:anti-anti-sigma factor
LAAPVTGQFVEDPYLPAFVQPLGGRGAWARIAIVGVLEQLRIDVRQEPDRVVLALEGELDMASAPLLQNAVDGTDLSNRRMVVLDLQGLQFIDSTGLRVILAVRKLCAERGQELAVTPGSQQVERLLSVTGVAEHLHTIPAPDAG